MGIVTELEKKAIKLHLIVGGFPPHGDCPNTPVKNLSTLTSPLLCWTLMITGVLCCNSYN